jgi:Arc/MetJ-type ribon-helix-helix transcriptional regulator
MYYMRTIVNISLPKEMADELKREVKREGFASTSEFIRALIREYKRAQLAKELHAQVRAFERAKAKGPEALKKAGFSELKSLKDLR